MSRRSAALILIGLAVAAGIASPRPRHMLQAQTATPNVSTISSAPLTHDIETTVGRPGFWRLGRSGGGTWWFLSPDNRREFLNGVTTVEPELAARDPHGAAYRSADFDGRKTSASLTRWAGATVRRVRDAGFKSLGAWCNPALHAADIPMTRDLNVSRWVPYDARLFDARWREEAENAIRVQTEPLRDNRSLVGYYIDNELDWDDEATGARTYFDALPPDDPNRAEVIRVIRDAWPTVAQFNRDWKTNLADWSVLQRQERLPAGSPPANERLHDHWLYHFARTYWRITTDLVRRHDPNHLILGCRYRGWAPPEVPRASRGLTDAQSINYYAGDALLDADTFRTIHEESGQPIVVSEYSFHALDGRSGDRNLSNFPALVPNQAARAEGYRLMTARLARVPYVVGADWFQWMDEPPSGRAADGEDANMGVVDIHDRPYELLAAAVRQTAPTLNDLHDRGAFDPNPQAIWRPSIAKRAAVAGAGD